MAEVLVVQHAAVESVGLIGEILRARGHTLRILRAFLGEVLPGSLEGVAGLVLMGGPMGVYEEDRYPFLRAGLRLIEEALRRDLPILGVCLGSQLLAAALGARVRPGSHPEVGWLPVELEEAAAEDRLFSGLPRRFVAFHWHGDVFDVPAGATGLARSERTPHQAFRYGDRAYGLLFHLEVDGSTVRAMVEAFPEDLLRAGVDPEEVSSAAERYLPGLRSCGAVVFGRWADLLG